MSVRRPLVASVASRAALIVGLSSVALGLGGSRGRAALAAQAGATGTGAGPRVGCFRGRPLPSCKSFWIVELQAETPLAQTTRTITYMSNPPVEIRSFDEELEWNLGHMLNLGPRHAVGGVFTLGAGDPLLAGVKLRGRRWLSADVSLELEGGFLRGDVYPEASFGATADARLNIRDQGSVYLRWDGLQLPRDGNSAGYLDPGGFQQAVYVGGGLGSVPALVGTGALGVGALILLAAFVASGGGS